MTWRDKAMELEVMSRSERLLRIPGLFLKQYRLFRSRCSRAEAMVASARLCWVVLKW